MILESIEEAQSSGSRLTPACEILGLDPTTVGRWRAQGGGEDRRRGPHREPGNKLSTAERVEVVQTLTSPQYRDLSPHQVVPQLADAGIYLASESTMYRILREEDLAAHRERSRPARRRKPQEWVATGPNQVWSWDITYLRSPVRGEFFYLYLITDVWSRKIMAAAVHCEESSGLAAELFLSVCHDRNLDPTGIVLHSDNGGPMKGSTMLATLERLGVIASFSRPRVSDDNPFSEALFRTLKYRPDFPSRPFASCEEARAWVKTFVTWYNTVHQHSAIRFVTPDDRHNGRELEILEHRRRVYESARSRHPERWSRKVRNWHPVRTVRLNPQTTEENKDRSEAA